MTTFAAYARYYDLLYRDKDYRGETEFVEKIISKHTTNPRRLLEMGCGTGVHAVMLAERGFDVVGIDLSDEMISAASQRVALLQPEIRQRLRFKTDDVRNAVLEGHFDAITSLFDVVSYQLTNDDLRQMFATVKTHLAPGGVFIFDCWYGPAVLIDRPVVRVKQLSDETTSVTRIAKPLLHPNLNRADIEYQLFIKDLRSGQVEEIMETHRMRYLFQPELDLLAEDVGLRIETAVAWMSGRKLDFSTWHACFVLKHRN